jgi:hypothetical protein
MIISIDDLTLACLTYDGVLAGGYQPIDSLFVCQTLKHPFDNTNRPM